MRADNLAPLLVAPGQPDLGYRQGVVLEWDPLTGANLIDVGGSKLKDLPTLAASTISLAAGDVVGLTRYKSTYFITGRIAPAGSGALVMQANAVGAEESTTSATYTNLATPGPAVSAYIGASRQCLVLIQVGVRFTGPLQAMAVFYVSGASTLTTVANPALLSTNTGEQLQATVTAFTLLTAASGLNAGFNTFTMKYAKPWPDNATNPEPARFAGRTITVIPF